MARIFPLILFLAISSSLFLPEKAKGASDAYVSALVSTAMKRKIYEEREWNILLHYKNTLFRPLHSLVDDPKFFLSPTGKEDPASELEASIRGMFDENSFSGRDDLHPLCRFPARKDFFTRKLDIDSAQFPVKNCENYKKALQKIDPRSVTLVFPFLYINKPVSMFGHTLLRINNRYNDPLLAHGVTFAADMPEDIDILSYTFKGMFGGYYGYFSVKEYYKTIFEYSNIDKRDIWEYDLDLTPAESLRLFNHLWELTDTGIDYFFFDENCSYNLLFLLEAARPSLVLTTSVLWEAPPDTVKLIYKSGIVTKINYRPSHVAIINNIARRMPRKTINLSKKVAEGEIPPEAVSVSGYSEKLKVAMLDLAIEDMRYEFLKKQANKVSLDVYKERTISLLKERAKYGIKSNYTIITPAAPHLGHDILSARAAVGVEGDQFYTELGFRLGFHSLHDFDAGYVPNTQAVVADINVRWNTATGEFTVPSATLASLGAYVPITKLFKQPSWRIDIAGETKDFKKKGSKFVPYLNGGIGATFRLFDNAYFWIMADLNLSFSTGYISVAGIGLGADGGLSYSFKYGKIMAEGYYRYYVLGGLGHETGASASYIFPLTKNNAITAKYERKMSWDVYKTDISLSWRFYF